jgi:hypothetical protein
MGKISASVLATLIAIGVSGAAMAQTMPSSPANSSSSGATMPDTRNNSSAGMQGSGMQGQVSSATQVKSTLQHSGYTSVSAIKKSSDGWTATAKKDGKSVHVAVDQQGNIETR